MSKWMPASEVYSSIAHKSTILIWEKQGKFPRGICLSPKVKVYERAQVDAFVEGMKAQQVQIEEKRNALTRLVRGRAGSQVAASKAGA